MNLGLRGNMIITLCVNPLEPNGNCICILPGLTLTLYIFPTHIYVLPVITTVNSHYFPMYHSLTNFLMEAHSAVWCTYVIVYVRKLTTQDLLLLQVPYRIKWQRKFSEHAVGYAPFWQHTAWMSLSRTVETVRVLASCALRITRFLIAF